MPVDTYSRFSRPASRQHETERRIAQLNSENRVQMQAINLGIRTTHETLQVMIAEQRQSQVKTDFLCGLNSWASLILRSIHRA